MHQGKPELIAGRPEIAALRDIEERAFNLVSYSVSTPDFHSFHAKFFNMDQIGNCKALNLSNFGLVIQLLNLR
jgi:hypothetical protein